MSSMASMLGQRLGTAAKNAALTGSIKQPQIAQGSLTPSTLATPPAPTPAAPSPTGPLQKNPGVAQAQTQTARAAPAAITKTTSAPSIPGVPPQAAATIGNIVSQMQKYLTTAGAPAKPADPTATSLKDPASYYQDSLNAVDQKEVTDTSIGNDALAAQQRRQATLSALSGVSGGGFLAGMNDATIGGVQAMQQQLSQDEQLRAGIYGQEATNAFSNEQRQSQNAFNVEQNTATQQGQADAQNQSNTQQNYLDGVNSSLKGLGIDATGSTGAGWNDAAPLVQAVQNATTPEQFAAAKASLDRYMAKLNALKAQNPGKKGNDWAGVVKAAQKNHYFDS